MNRENGIKKSKGKLKKAVPKNDFLPIRCEAPSTKTNILTNKNSCYYIHKQVARPAAMMMSRRTLHMEG
jgi:hypothetical protein